MKVQKRTHHKWMMLAILVGMHTLAARGVMGQSLEERADDSGWVNLFNGTNLDGLYTYIGGGPGFNNDQGKVFSAVDGTIQTKAFNGAGYIATKEKFSYYRVKVEFKFANLGNPTENAGLLYHIRDAGLGGWYPRSIEFQMQKRGAGEMWTIDGVWINTKVEIADARPRRYDPKGVEVAHGDPPWLQCLGSSNPYVDGEWNRAEALVLGADSVEHRVNGIATFRGWKLRVGGENNFENPLNDGTIGLQSEAADIFYRNFKVQPLDKTGKPLYAKKVVSVLPLYRRSLIEKGNAAVHTLGSPVNSRGSFMLRRDSPGGVSAYSLNGSRISFIDLQFPVIPE